VNVSVNLLRMLTVLAVGLLWSCQTEGEDEKLLEGEKPSSKKLKELWLTERDRGYDLFSVSWDDGSLRQWGEGELSWEQANAVYWYLDSNIHIHGVHNWSSLPFENPEFDGDLYLPEPGSEDREMIVKLRNQAYLMLSEEAALSVLLEVDEFVMQNPNDAWRGMDPFQMRYSDALEGAAMRISLIDQFGKFETASETWRVKISKTEPHLTVYQKREEDDWESAQTISPSGFEWSEGFLLVQGSEGRIFAYNGEDRIWVLEKRDLPEQSAQGCFKWRRLNWRPMLQCA